MGIGHWERGRWGDGKPKTCGGTRPLREVAQPVHAERAASGGDGEIGRGGDKGTKGQEVSSASKHLAIYHMSA